MTMMTENIENNDAFASALASAASEKPPLAARPPKTKSNTTKKTILALGSVLLVFGLAAGIAILVSNLNNNNDAASSNVASDVSNEKLEVIPVDEEVPVEEFGVFEEPPVVAEEPIVVKEEPVVVAKVEPTEWDEEDCPEEPPAPARALQNTSVQLFNRRVMKNHINKGGKKKQHQLLRGGRRLQPEPESKSKKCKSSKSDVEPSLEANKEQYKKESKSKKKESKSKKKTTSKTSKSDRSCFDRSNRSICEETSRCEWFQTTTGGFCIDAPKLATADGTEEEEAGESVFGKTDSMCMSMAGMSMSM